MDGFKAYKYYMATKLHFTTDKFDVFTNRNVKGTRDAYNNRNDRYLFEKLARKFSSDHDLIQYYVANMAYGNIGVIYSDLDAEDNLLTWVKRKQSITKVFSDDLSKIVFHLETNKKSQSELFTFDHDNFPELLKMFLGDHVTLETMVILDHYTQYLPEWKKFTNLLWEEECRRIVKSKGFVKFDESRTTSVYQHFLQELQEL
jgi:hypothetical protein